MYAQSKELQSSWCQVDALICGPQAEIARAPLIQKSMPLARFEHKFVEVPRGAMCGWKNKKPVKPPQIVWLLGRPAAGKSFLADYLATQGWEAVDGDFLQESKNPKDKEMWMDVFKMFQLYWC